MVEDNDIKSGIQLRQNLLGVLDLWSSKKKQLDYQKDVPIAQVSSELFNQWSDFYYPDTVQFRLAFVKKEREILKDFDKLINHICDKIPKRFIDINEFVKTNDWLLINRAAIDTVMRIEVTAANKK